MHVPLISIALASCSTEDLSEQTAEFSNYYFQITQASSDVNVSDLITPLVEELEKDSYAITNESGKNWPFFQRYKQDEAPLKTDLMPPHLTGHRLLRMKESKELEVGDSRLDIVLKTQDDAFSFDMIIYRWEGASWKKIVNTGNHRIPMEKYASEEDLIRLLYQMIVRYSFK